MSTEEENKAVVHQLMEAFNSRDREAFDACYAEEIVVHGRRGDRTLDHDAHWAEVQSIFQTFPDRKEKLLGMAAEDDHVFIYWTNTATHLGKSESGIEPTGKQAEWWGFSDYRFEDGKIVEAWQIHDSLDLYLQLGLVELPEA